MEYTRLELQLDLNDPEKGFSFSSSGTDPLTLSLVDWRNRKVKFRFYTTFLFSHRYSNGLNSLPEAEVLEINDSLQIQALRDNGCASEEEELHHYIISTNEDEWCEIIAERFEIEREEQG